MVTGTIDWRPIKLLGPVMNLVIDFETDIGRYHPGIGSFKTFLYPPGPIWVTALAYAEPKLNTTACMMIVCRHWIDDHMYTHKLGFQSQQIGGHGRLLFPCSSLILCERHVNSGTRRGRDTLDTAFLNCQEEWCL